MEPLEFIEVTCRTLITVISQIFPGALCDLLLQLLTCVTILRSQWQSYSDSIIVLHGNIRSVLHTGMPGRPQFDINKEELEYLTTLSFSWSEIAALIGVSRSTVFRYVYFCASLVR